MNFTTKFKTLCLCTISLLFSSAMLADTYPGSDELIGRYHFSGKCSVEAPNVPAVNDYDVIILPTETENQFYICGLLGFGGGVVTTYNPEDGTLTCNSEGYLCSNIDLSTFTGYYYVYSYTNVPPFTLEAKKEDGIIITATSDFTCTDGVSGSNITYEAGFTLTEKDVNIPVEKFVGSYNFKSNSGVISNFIWSSSRPSPQVLS